MTFPVVLAQKNKEKEHPVHGSGKAREFECDIIIHSAIIIKKVGDLSIVIIIKSGLFGFWLLVAHEKWRSSGWWR